MLIVVIILWQMWFLSYLFICRKNLCNISGKNSLAKGFLDKIFTYLLQTYYDENFFSAMNFCWKFFGMVFSWHSGFLWSLLLAKTPFVEMRRFHCENIYFWWMVSGLNVLQNDKFSCNRDFFAKRLFLWYKDFLVE